MVGECRSRGLMGGARVQGSHGMGKEVRIPGSRERGESGVMGWGHRSQSRTVRGSVGPGVGMWVLGTQGVESAIPQYRSACPQTQASCLSFPSSSILYSPAMSTWGSAPPPHCALPRPPLTLCSPPLLQLQPLWETRPTGCRSFARGCGMSHCTTCPSQVSAGPTSRPSQPSRHARLG